MNKEKASAVTPGKSESNDNEKYVLLTLHLVDRDVMHAITTTQDVAEQALSHLEATEKQGATAILAFWRVKGWVTSDSGAKSPISWCWAKKNIEGVEVEGIDKI